MGDNDYIVKRRRVAIALRAQYIFLNVVCPFYNNGFSLGTFAIIMLMGVSESLFLSVLFSVSHNFVDSDRDPMKPYMVRRGRVLVQAPGRIVLHLRRRCFRVPDGGLEFSGGASPFPAHEQCALPLHCSQGPRDLQEAWSEVCLLPLDSSEFDFDLPLHARCWHWSKLGVRALVWEVKAFDVQYDR